MTRDRITCLLVARSEGIAAKYADNRHGKPAPSSQQHHAFERCRLGPATNAQTDTRQDR